MEIKLNDIYNIDCFQFMNENGENWADVILTSPPYNTARGGVEFFNDVKNGRYTARYVDFNDNRTHEEYSKWTCDLFNLFDKCLVENGVVIYNINYGTYTHESFWQLIADIQANSPFCVADCICWKKKSALPNSASSNKLTRLWEPVFVFCRKSEYKTFTANKKCVSQSKGTGQKNYENVFNYIEAKNNDGSCSIHKATYSTELCEKLLNIYAKEGFTVFDPFIGTGTTALAARNLKMNYVGCEIYKDYYDLCVERLK